MFPIRDHNPSERVPFITYALLAVNTVVFLYMWPLYGTAAASEVFIDFGMIPARVLHGFGLETLITSMFLHGGFMHFSGNMLFLWIFGDNLEDMLGHVLFLLFYLATGVAAALLQFATDPGSSIPMIGASGAIAGVMGGVFAAVSQGEGRCAVHHRDYLQDYPRPGLGRPIGLVWIAAVQWCINPRGRRRRCCALGPCRRLHCRICLNPAALATTWRTALLVAHRGPPRSSRGEIQANPDQHSPDRTTQALNAKRMGPAEQAQPNCA